MNDTIISLLRRELPKAGSLTSIQKATGVKRQSIALFLRGERSMRLDFADKLVTFLGIECRMPRRKGK